MYYIIKNREQNIQLDYHVIVFTDKRLQNRREFLRYDEFDFRNETHGVANNFPYDTEEVILLAGTIFHVL